MLLFLFFVSVFFKFFGGHESFLWGHWYPCFWTSGDISPRFQSPVVLCSVLYSKFPLVSSVIFDEKSHKFSFSVILLYVSSLRPLENNHQIKDTEIIKE